MLNTMVESSSHLQNLQRKYYHIDAKKIASPQVVMIWKILKIITWRIC
jgi:hypothetical protein